MSGTIRGVIDGLTNETTEFRDGSNIFKTWFDAIEAHPNTTRVALQYGNGASGTDFWDGANPSGTNAFAVWSMAATAARPYVYYFAIQGGGAVGATYGAVPGDPGTHTGQTSSNSGQLTVCAAIGVGGDSNPWNGTTNNDGTDRKGGSSALPNGNDGLGGVWRVPVGGTDVICFPRTNNPGGSAEGANAVTRRGSMIAFNAGSQAATRYHLVMDDDNLVFYTDVGNNGGGQFCFLGPYDPHPSLTVTYPFLCFGTTGTIEFGTSNEGLSGVATPDGSAYPVMRLNMDTVSSLTAANEPNLLFTVPQYDLISFYVQVVEPPAQGLVGAFGDSNDSFFLWTYNVPWRSTSGSLTRAVIGSATLAQWKPSIPWDGATVPGTTLTRAGIVF